MRLATRLLLACLLLPIGAQSQVFQLQGGGSSLFAGYGGMVNVWGNGFEASLGVGYLDGLKVGASARRLLGGRDTLRLGNDLLPLAFDSDVFQTGGMLFAQGVSLQRRRGRLQTWLFGGASASALSAPYFASQRPVRGMGYARSQYDVSRTLSLSSHVVASDRQTVLATARWSPLLGVTTAATAGVGNNAPYGALSTQYLSPQWEAKVALVGMGRRFRRASGPMPLQSEIDGENALFTWRPRDGWSLGVGRQHFRQDSAFQGIPQRAALNQIIGSGRVFSTSISTGWLFSSAGETDNVSSYASVKRDVHERLQAELYLLRVWEPVLARLTTPVLILRETVSPRLSLLQTITRDQGRTTVNFGGTISTSQSTFGIEYQLAHSPYLTANPFVQTMGLNARLQLGGLTFSLGSFVTPDGKVHYSAQGSTFVYRGDVSGSAVSGGGGGSGRIDQFVIAGTVSDEAGTPIDGAAIELGRDVVYTDSQGRFFLRRPTASELPLRVLLNDFLGVGTYEVVSAPARATPTKGNGKPLSITLRRVTGVKN